MGLGGINIWSLLVILVIVLAVFGTKKLRGMGGDLGGAVKGFKNAVKEGGEEAADAVKGTAENLENKAADAIDGDAAKSNSDKA